MVAKAAPEDEKARRVIQTAEGRLTVDAGAVAAHPRGSPASSSHLGDAPRRGGMRRLGELLSCRLRGEGDVVDPMDAPGVAGRSGDEQSV